MANFFGDFILSVFLNWFYFLIFSNSGLVARNYKKALRNTCSLLFHIAVCAEKLELSIQCPRRTSRACYHSSTANSNKSLYTCTTQSVYKDYINFLNLSYQNFNLVHDCSWLVLNFWATLILGLLIKFVLIKKSVYPVSCMHRSLTVTRNVREHYGKSRRLKNQSEHMKHLCHKTNKLITLELN